jgi:hypothetical protein
VWCGPDLNEVEGALAREVIVGWTLLSPIFALPGFLDMPAVLFREASLAGIYEKYVGISW